MKQTVVLKSPDSKLMGKVDDELVNEFLIKKKKTTNPGHISEKRETTLSSGKKIKTNIDPEMKFDISLF